MQIKFFIQLYSFENSVPLETARDWLDLAAAGREKEEEEGEDGAAR